MHSLVADSLQWWKGVDGIESVGGEGNGSEFSVDGVVRARPNKRSAPSSRPYCTSSVAETVPP